MRRNPRIEVITVEPNDEDKSDYEKDSTADQDEVYGDLSSEDELKNDADVIEAVEDILDPDESSN